ncbi:MAG: hypothetical protein WC030_00945 [Candidatus Paceibacterota bacterium]
MTKIILTSVGAVTVAGLLTAAFWMSRPPLDEPATPNPAVTLPVAGQSSQGTSTPVLVDGDTRPLTLGGADGEAVIVKDFLSDPTVVQDPINAGYYYLGYHLYQGVSDPSVTDNPPYTIAYARESQFFTISLLQEPLAAVRESAERELMTRLGLSSGELCRLKYTLSVPWRVNQVYASKSLGFSFCAGATTLPK